MKYNWRHCAIIGCKNIETNDNLNYHMFPKNKNDKEIWFAKIVLNPVLLEEANKNYVRFRRRYGVCGLHFELSQYQTSEKKKLNRNAVPTIVSLDGKLDYEPTVTLPNKETETIQPEKPQRTIKEPVYMYDDIIMGYYEEHIKQVDDTVTLDELPERSDEEMRGEEKLEEKLEEKPMKVKYKTRTWRKCAVPNCVNAKTNWNAAYFTFPMDQKLLEEWLNAIKNPKLTLLNTEKTEKIRRNHGVCARHFEDSQFKSIRKLSLKSKAEIPCKFLSEEEEPDPINGLLLQVDQGNVGTVVSQIQMSVTTTVTDIDKESSCRVCLTKTDPKNLYCLFGTNAMFEELSVAAALQDCFNIYLKEDEELPNYVCINCASSTLQAYTFRRCIIKCQSVLKSQKVEKEDDELNPINLSPQGILFDCLTKDKTEDVEHTINNEISAEVFEDKKCDPLIDHSYTKEIIIEDEKPAEILPTKKKVKSAPDKWWLKERGPPYQCKICGRNYGVRYYAFYMHVRAHRMNKPSCSQCGKKFTRDKMIVHMRSHTKEKPFVCDQCPARFTIEGNLKRHLYLHSGEKLYVCDECGKAFTQSTTLMSHKQTHSKEVQFVCEYCGKICTTNGSLQTHIRHIHKFIKREEAGDSINKYTCQECDKVFKSKASLSFHSKIHTFVKLECNLCTKILYSDNNYDVHMLWHRVIETDTANDVIKKWECELCNDIHEDREVLASHVLSHSDLQFDCNYCSKSFPNRQALVHHSRRHSDERPFACRSCPKTFKYVATLRQHEKVHTGERPYRCDICERQFSQQQQLISHKYTHTGEKKYVCPYCGKAFALNGNLTVHKRRHTGETPYVCDVCLKGFYDSSSLKKHKTIHHRR